MYAALARAGEQVRRHQAEPRAAPLGPRWPFPVESAPQVGQVVTVRHAATRLLARGTVLAADVAQGEYRVQFDRCARNPH